MKYASYDYVIAGYWHIYGSGILIELWGSETPEMQAAVAAIVDAIDAAYELADKERA